MIKIECEVSDIQAFLDERAKLASKIDDQQRDIRLAWKTADDKSDKIEGLETLVLGHRDQINTLEAEVNRLSQEKPQDILIAELRGEIAALRTELDQKQDEIKRLIQELKVSQASLVNGYCDQLPSGAHQSWVNDAVHRQTEQFLRDLISAVLDHRKIAVIKAVRCLGGPPSDGPMGLKEAKDLVEEFEPFAQRIGPFSDAPYKCMDND
jgi:ribosomal protein L7/L12